MRPPAFHEPRSAGLRPASSTGVSPVERAGGQTPPKLAVADDCAARFTVPRRDPAVGGAAPPRGLDGHGFSLIELMVVVVLIGIMAAMIIPEMKGTYEDALLRSASRELIGAFNTASSRAISLNQRLRVRLDRRTGQYAIERPVSDRGGGGNFVPLRDVPGGAGKLDTRISIEIRKPGVAETGTEPAPSEAAMAEAGARGRPADDAIGFYPDGTADAVEILLQDREGFRLALRINPITARVRVVQWERP